MTRDNVKLISTIQTLARKVFGQIILACRGLFTRGGGIGRRTSHIRDMVATSMERAVAEKQNRSLCRLLDLLELHICRVQISTRALGESQRNVWINGVRDTTKHLSRGSFLAFAQLKHASRERPAIFLFPRSSIGRAPRLNALDVAGFDTCRGIFSTGRSSVGEPGSTASCVSVKSGLMTTPRMRHKTVQIPPARLVISEYDYPKTNRRASERLAFPSSSNGKTCRSRLIWRFDSVRGIFIDFLGWVNPTGFGQHKTERNRSCSGQFNVGSGRLLTTHPRSTSPDSAAHLTKPELDNMGVG